MQANNTPVGTPEALSSQPQKVGAIKGLSTKIVAALAALGIATSAEKVDAATIIPVTGLPTGATVSMIGPQVSGGSALNTSGTTLINTQYDSRMFDTTARTSDTSTDRITVTFTGIGEGNLTITGIIKARTGDVTDASNGSGFLNTPYTISQEVRFGRDGQASSIIGSLTSVGSGKGTNAGGPGFTNDEEWFASGNVNYTFPISGPGTYYLDNIMRRENTTGTAELQNFTMNFTAIPEPSTGLMAGGVLAAGLLRRRREKEKSNN